MEDNGFYQEIGKNFRFFLSWRYGVIAAYFFLIWGAYNLALNTIKISNQITGLLLIIASLISIFLWLAECRTRDIFRELIQKGKEIEKKNPKVNKKSGAYSSLNMLRIHRLEIFSQSFSINCIFATSFITLFAFGYILMNAYFKYIPPANLYDLIKSNISYLHLILSFNIPLITSILLIGYREINHKKCRN